MRKEIIVKIKGYELDENVPVLVMSVLPREEGYTEKIILEVKQYRKSEPKELLNANWFKVETRDFYRVLHELMRGYFFHLLKKGVSVNAIREEMSRVVYSALKTAHSKYLSKGDEHGPC